jgi:hypothetical protein
MGNDNCTPLWAKRLTGKYNAKTIKIIASHNSLRRAINILYLQMICIIPRSDLQTYSFLSQKDPFRKSAKKE